MEPIDFSSRPKPWQTYLRDLPPIQFPQEMSDEDEAALFTYLNQAVVMLGELRSELRVSLEGEIQSRPRHNPHYHPDPEKKVQMWVVLSHAKHDFHNFRNGFEQLGLSSPPPAWGDRPKKSAAKTVENQVDATRNEFLSIPSSHDLPIAKDLGPSPSSEPIAAPDEYSMPDQVRAYKKDRLQALLAWFNQELASGNAMPAIRRWYQEREEARNPKPKPESGKDGQDW